MCFLFPSEMCHLSILLLAAQRVSGGCGRMSMTASSPVQNNSGNLPSAAPPTPNGSTTPPGSSFEMPKQSLRGIKKPKCIKCGNIARSRCPFQSCKSCCSKAQNPCHIHVLKLNGTLPDKPAPASSPLPEQQTSDALSSLSGAAMRLSSLRQLSSTFINSLRTRKPLSRKDADGINRWRFAKLKEHMEGNSQIKDDAFDRYMQNVHFLEEIFSVNSFRNSMFIQRTSISEDDFSRLVTGIKVRLKSNSERVYEFRERVQGIVDSGLDKLKNLELGVDEVSEIDVLDNVENYKRKRVLKTRLDRTAAVGELVNNLIKVRSEDDLKSCLEMKYQLFNQDGVFPYFGSSLQTSDVMTANGLPDSLAAASYSLLQMFTTVHIGESGMPNIDEEFCSLSQTAKL